jgi:3-deoxy-manno-octulosonate cytidylyltransferase (CMP-KDO synthetase)
MTDASRHPRERVIAVIPTRWASTRFPGKPLVDLAGKPLVRHCWEAACAAGGIDDVIVATDDHRIADAVIGFGGRVAMTRDDHPSGSDRLAEVAAAEPCDIIVNLQGDEPLVDPLDLAALAATMRNDPDLPVATLCHRIDAAEAGNPNRVKVVRDAAGNALYFSRAPIPFDRDGTGASPYLQHVGVYAYRRDVIRAFPSLPRPAEELAESLEQLRLLAAGYRIRVLEVAPTGPGVDTPEDLEVVKGLLAARG